LTQTVVDLEGHWTQHEEGLFEQEAAVQQLEALNVAVELPLQAPNLLLLQPMVHPENKGAEIYHYVHNC
jgi:hypothetical protein